MSWRSILISHPAKLSLHHNQLLIEQAEKISIPLEDIAVIVVEAREIIITLPLLSALATNGVTLIGCDHDFLPCGQWLSLQQHHRHLKIINKQILLTKAKKNKLWQLIIQSKINNQAWILNYIGDFSGANYLVEMSKKVLLADKTNMESQAAVFYFKHLFGSVFVRHSDYFINDYLNYGYTIIRSAIARSLSQYGFLSTLGIFHHNELNPFNLADDLIEPYRPLVDLWVWKNYSSGDLKPEIDTPSKQRLILLLHHILLIDNRKYSVLSAIDKNISSLQRSILDGNPNTIKLPKLLGLKEYQYE